MRRFYHALSWGFFFDVSTLCHKKGRVCIRLSFIYLFLRKKNLRCALNVKFDASEHPPSCATPARADNRQGRVALEEINKLKKKKEQGTHAPSHAQKREVRGSATWPAATIVIIVTVCVTVCLPISRYPTTVNRTEPQTRSNTVLDVRGI